jgi:hypothetical protein
MLRSITLLALAAFLPQTPDVTQPPAAAHVRFVADGRGVQVYACTVKDNAFAWKFQEPQADLFDAKTHQPVGKHSAGPTWTWNDGSAITGKLLQTRPSTDPTNIPWLLLEAHSTGTPGALADITYVRRSDTHGGAAPTSACDADHNGVTAKVPYKATYTFYATTAQ